MAEPQTIPRPGRPEPHHALLAITVIWIALALIWMPAMPFTVDGYVAAAMAQAMAEHGSLLINNGYAAAPTPALNLPLITPHDGQLAPQYPGGWGLIAAPAWALGSMRGVMVFNALLGAATIWIVYATAERLSDRKDIAL